MNDNMKLPEGKTCSDCRNWPSCRAFVGSLTGKETSCDWAPNRFVESNESLMRQIDTLKNEKIELMNDLQRIHERAEEALADDDNYASWLAVIAIQEITAKRAYPASKPFGDTEKLAIAVKALEWYSDIGNNLDLVDGGTNVSIDGGMRARIAYSEIRRLTNGN